MRSEMLGANQLVGWGPLTSARVGDPSSLSSWLAQQARPLSVESRTLRGMSLRRWRPTQSSVGWMMTWWLWRTTSGAWQRIAVISSLCGDCGIRATMMHLRKTFVPGGSASAAADTRWRTPMTVRRSGWPTVRSSLACQHLGISKAQWMYGANVYVVDEHRRNGVARQLMLALIEFAEANAMVRVVLAPGLPATVHHQRRPSSRPCPLARALQD